MVKNSKPAQPKPQIVQVLKSSDAQKNNGLASLSQLLLSHQKTEKQPESGDKEEKPGMVVTEKLSQAQNDQPPKTSKLNNRQDFYGAIGQLTGKVSLLSHNLGVLTFTNQDDKEINIPIYMELSQKTWFEHHRKEGCILNWIVYVRDLPSIFYRLIQNHRGVGQDKPSSTPAALDNKGKPKPKIKTKKVSPKEFYKQHGYLPYLLQLVCEAKDDTSGSKQRQRNQFFINGNLVYLENKNRKQKEGDEGSKNKKLVAAKPEQKIVAKIVRDKNYLRKSPWKNEDFRVTSVNLNPISGEGIEIGSFWNLEYYLDSSGLVLVNAKKREGIHDLRAEYAKKQKTKKKFTKQNEKDRGKEAEMKAKNTETKASKPILAKKGLE